MKRTLICLAFAASVLGLAACGYSTQDRALSGAGIGAGVGAVGGALVGGDPVAGAVVGGAVGAGVGALTSPNQVNLSRPDYAR